MKEAAERGSTAAMVNYGKNLLNGEGIEKNYEEGIKWLRKSAREGNPDAASALYWELKEKNPEEAFDFLKQAAKGGVEGCLEFLIAKLAQNETMYVLDTLTEGKNALRKSEFEEYNYWLDLGIARDVTHAYSCKGIEMIKGENIPKDIKKGVEYISYAADKGDSTAMMQMAQYYSEGFPPYIERNIEKAISFCHETIRDNEEYDIYDGNAELLLGKIYVYPKYGMNNLTRGIQFLEQASKYGNSIADATLAELFSQGELISIDIDRALYYAEKFKASNGIQGERLYNDIYNKLSKQEESNNGQKEVKRKGILGFFRK